MLVEKYFQHPIISMYSDNGGEYMALKPVFQACGISHFTTPPHTPELNGMAERRNRHITKTGLALLHHASLPLSFWSFAFQTSSYLINRLPTPTLNNKTPYELLFRNPIGYQKLRVFGCLCYPWIRPYNDSKLQRHSKPCVFIGYSESQNAYRCYDYVNNRIYVSRHVNFVENIFPFQVTSREDLSSFPLSEASHVQVVKPTSSNQSPPEVLPPARIKIQSPVRDVPESLNSATSITHMSEASRKMTHSDVPEPHDSVPYHNANQSQESTPHSPHVPSHSSIRPTRVRHPNPKYYSDAFVNHTTSHPLPSTGEPTSVSQAIRDPHWRDAMSKEFTALIQNGTWELVPKHDQNLAGCKWIFRIKRKPDGSIDRYKARLVAKGFHQRPGLDYSETFAPVTKPTTIRIVLCLALSYGWPLRQLDINNAFLNGTLHEPVYMLHPLGFVETNFPDHVCLLKKSIYGLKQASYEWHQELRQFLLHFGFYNSISDASLFIYNQNGFILYFLVYMDDIVLTGNNIKFLNFFVEKLHSKFSLKDLGTLHQFLGVEVLPTLNGIFLSQHRYIKDILEAHKMTDAKGVTTPLSTSGQLTVHDTAAPSDATIYRKIVGSLQYL